MKTNKTNLTLDGTAVGLNDGDVDGLVDGLEISLGELLCIIDGVRLWISVGFIDSLWLGDRLGTDE